MYLAAENRMATKRLWTDEVLPRRQSVMNLNMGR